MSSSAVAFVNAARHVAEDDDKADEQRAEDECLAPTAAALAPATRTLEHADARGEIPLIGDEVVRRDRRLRVRRQCRLDG